MGRQTTLADPQLPNSSRSLSTDSTKNHSKFGSHLAISREVNLERVFAYPVGERDRHLNNLEAPRTTR
jgi:hypothetical protein